MQLTRQPGHGQFPAISEVPALYNPAYTLPSQHLPGIISYPDILDLNLTSAASLSQLVPPIDPSS